MESVVEINNLRILVVGCLHGELDEAYRYCEDAMNKDGKCVDLVLVCGDFESFRNESDLACMRCPEKYRNMADFWKYYNGTAVAPVLTIFIHGNHEASNYLMELPYGGWVARNIYYLGFGGVVNFGGVRIGGFSGIYDKKDFQKGRYETCPLSEQHMVSIYHCREYEMKQFMQLREPVDIMMSHDWPSYAGQLGNTEELFRNKPFLKNEILSGELGNPAAYMLLKYMSPQFWFAGHMHVKHAAVYTDEGSPATYFLALDKIGAGKSSVQIVDLHAKEIPATIPSGQTDGLCFSRYTLSYDVEWLSVVKNTQVFYPRDWMAEMPSRDFPIKIKEDETRYDFRPTSDEIAGIHELFPTLEIPNNWRLSTTPYYSGPYSVNAPRPMFHPNIQTAEFCNTLQVNMPCFDGKKKWLHPSEVKYLAPRTQMELPPPPPPPMYISPEVNTIPSKDDSIDSIESVESIESIESIDSIDNNNNNNNNEEENTMGYVPITNSNTNWDYIEPVTQTNTVKPAEPSNSLFSSNTTIFNTSYDDDLGF